MRWWASVLVRGVLNLSCGDVTIRGAARCDGLKQAEEPSVDAAFDQDQDGYFDGNNPGCQDTYDVLDCDDSSADVYPGATELVCSDRDADSANTPGNTESCGDGVGNNCDGQADEGCAGGSGYDGSYTVTPSIRSRRVSTTRAYSAPSSSPSPA